MKKKNEDANQIAENTFMCAHRHTFSYSWRNNPF